MTTPTLSHEKGAAVRAGDRGSASSSYKTRRSQKRSPWFLFRIGLMSFTLHLLYLLFGGDGFCLSAERPGPCDKSQRPRDIPDTQHTGTPKAQISKHVHSWPPNPRSWSDFSDLDACCGFLGSPSPTRRTRVPHSSPRPRGGNEGGREGGREGREGGLWLG